MQTYEFNAVYRQFINCYPKDVDKVKEIVMKKIANAMFGEFKESMYSLLESIYSRNDDISIQKAQDIIKMIEP